MEAEQGEQDGEAKRRGEDVKETREAEGKDEKKKEKQKKMRRK